jgi:streptogramin lyase
MPDLETRFRDLDRVRGPDLWPDIETRQPGPMHEGGTTRRVAVAAVALLLAAGGAVLVVRAFLGGDQAVERRVRPAESPPAPVDPVVDVTLPIKWPSSIVYGEGSIWVAASANDGTGAGTVYRIDPDTAEILAEIPSLVIPGWDWGGAGMEIAEGSLWIAGYLDDGSQGGLVRIDTSTNEVADVFPLGGHSAGDVSVDEHGIWVTLDTEPSVELARLDPRTLVVDIRTGLGVDWAREILSIDGHVWVVVEKNRIIEVDPATAQVVQEVHVPYGFSFISARGAIWATTWRISEGNLLARIDPATGAIELLPSGPLDGLAEAGEGGLWGRGRGIDETRGRHGVVRFNPETGRIDASVELDEGQNPIDLAVAPGSVWVIHYQEGVTRVELRPL